jgi:hypothetical protein
MPQQDEEELLSGETRWTRSIPKWDGSKNTNTGDYS